VDIVIDKGPLTLSDPQYSVCILQLDHTEALQNLFEQCADYTLLVEGQGVSPDAARDTFEDVPPGHPLEHKFVYGILNEMGELTGVLEGMRHYPEEGVWWIGLFLLDPAVRGQELGQKVIAAFADFVRINDGSALMLGVVEDNQAAYRFWQGQGFVLVRTTEPRTFGSKTQRVFVLRRELM
jgi:GNAT superfamily N-acetyltransferase